MRRKAQRAQLWPMFCQLSDRVQPALCPTCGHAADFLGLLPPGFYFAGRKLDAPVPGGALWRCPSCLLVFRWPRPHRDQLAGLYSLAHGEVWQYEYREREDWLIARDLITRLPKGSIVLDVGCFDGAFLAGLGESYSCMGIELNESAAERARSRGVTIVGHDMWATLNALPKRGVADCVTSFDVIEHVDDPRAFLRLCVRAAKPGGLVIIASGNSDSIWFRLLRNRYWYVSIPEHLSFVGRSWFSSAAKDCDLILERVVEIAHRKGRLTRRVKELLTNLAWGISPPLLAATRAAKAMLMGKRRKWAEMLIPPGWETGRNHLLVVGRRKADKV